MIRAVMNGCAIVLALNIANVAYNAIVVKQDEDNAPMRENVEYATSKCEVLPINAVIDEVSMNTISSARVATLEFKELERTMSASPIVNIASVSMKTNNGAHIITDEISVDVDSLLELFYTDVSTPVWDDENKINTLRVLWNFLVEQQGIPETNAAGLLGNIYEEGEFAEQQGTDLYISNIEQARTLLGSGKVGYGCAQWTYSARQRSLLEYYELAYAMYPDDWDKVRIIAECCMLLEECKAYNVFNDIYSPTSIEDATGRVAMKYETYSGCEEQWSKVNGSYKVTTQSGTGYKRLCYAYDIYKYFNE